MKRIVISILIITLLASTLVGCKGDAGAEKAGNATDSTKTKAESLLFWHTYSDTEEQVFLEQIMPKFEELNPGVGVEVVRMPYDGLKQQLITSIAGGVAPDVMRMDIIWVPEFANMGALEKVSDKDGFDQIKNNVFEGPLNTTFYQGEYYGLPLNTNTKIAIYNKQLLEGLNAEAPTSFDELINLSRQLKGQEDVWGIGLSGTHAWGMPPYFWSLGGRITNDDYTKASGYINSPESVSALETIVALNDEGLIAPCILGEEPGTWGGMEANNYLMIDDGPWYFSMQREAGVEDLVVPALFPSGQEGSHSIIGGEDVVMFSSSKAKDAAWSFMSFLLSEETQVTMGGTGLIPALKSAANNEAFSNDPINKVYVEQLETAFPRTPHYKWERISEEFQLAFEMAIRKEGEPKVLLDELAVKLDGILSE